MSDKRGDIEKYKNGKLTPAEMHALEKKALRDPFLADALEGAESVSSDDFSADVKDLQDSIHFRSEEKKAISFDRAPASASAMSVDAKERILSIEPETTNNWVWPLRIAAFLIILIGVFWIANQLIPQGGKGNLALKKEEVKKPSNSSPSESPTDSAVAKEPTIPSSDGKQGLDHPKQPTQDSFAQPGQVKSRLKATPLAPKEQEKQPARLDVSTDAENLSRIAENKTLQEVIVSKEENTPAAVSPVPFAKNKSADDESDSKVARKEHKDQEEFIKGRVLSAEDGTPLPGVNVVVQGTSQGAVTDVNGNYQLAFAENKKLVFSYIGFQTQLVDALGKQSVDVKLEPDATQLSEVVVTGSGLSDDSERTPVIRLAEPIGGRKAYNKYLETDVRYPIQALEQKIKGRVTVQFTVRIDGSLDEFNVVKSLGHGCDEEVIRLVREGPAWSPTTEDSVPVESEVLVRVKFDPAKAKR
jgi:TonB family protein